MSRQDEQIAQEEINNASGGGATPLCRAPTQKPQISPNPRLILNQQQDSGSGNSLLLSPFIVFAALTGLSERLSANGVEAADLEADFRRGDALPVLADGNYRSASKR